MQVIILGLGKRIIKVDCSPVSIIFLFTGFLILCLPSHSVYASEKDFGPKRVVEQFCKLDANGARLSTEGWKKIAPFVTWSAEMHDEIMPGEHINIIKKYRVKNVVIFNAKAKVDVEYIILGLTDTFTFFPSEQQVITVSYDLVLQNNTWRIKAPAGPYVHWENTIEHLQLIQKEEPARKESLKAIINKIKYAANGK